MAVYTTVSDQDLEHFLSAYDIGEPLSCKGIAEGVENSNYLLVTSDGPHILTLYEKRVDPADLPFFLGLMDHLSAKGFACPTPIRGHDGQALRTLNGKPAAIVSFLPGLWPRRPQPEHCAALGTAMAKMHGLTADFPLTRPNDLSLDGWHDLADRCRAHGDTVQPGLMGLIDGELEALSQHWPRDLPQGTIHADLFPDNVFFRREAFSGFIDFYFACTDTLAYDLAVALNAWAFEEDLSFNITKGRRLISGYAAERSLTAAEREALPWLCRGSALRFLLTRLYDWVNTPADALVKPKDPLAFAQRLRFHQGVERLQDYGVFA